MRFAERTPTRRRKRHHPEQIVHKLRDADAMLNAGKNLSVMFYPWVDGVHFNIRLEEGRPCILVLMGATKDGRKELIAVADGYRESEQSWKALLLDGNVLDELPKRLQPEAKERLHTIWMVTTRAAST